MKKIIYNIIFSSLFICSAAVMAKPTPSNTTVTLYSQPSTSSKAVTTVTPDDPLVQIYQHNKEKKWIKVGDRNNGQVGWLNTDDYRAALKNYQQQATQVTLYSQPNSKSKSVATITAATALVPIITSDDHQWIKVGDQQTGQVGWINRQAYEKAKWYAWQSNSMMPEDPLFLDHHDHDIRNVYVTVTNKDGKQHISAYKNGKKLSDKQAKKLWQNMQKRQEHVIDQNINMQHHIDDNMNQMMQNSDNDF
ncbi:MAG: SH3 domain-containing protein [Pseudomonadota bacterium]